MKKEKRRKKKATALILLLLIFTITPIFAQTTATPWWMSLEQGKIKFREADYGEALMLFEDARRDRRAMYEQMERDLIALLSINEVRRIGDRLDHVEWYINTRYYTAASAALDELYYRVPKDNLKNSASAALEAIGELKDYPEAEYWIGEVYRAEGELSLALMQYRRAYEIFARNKDKIYNDNPGFGIDLLYKTAETLLVRQEYNEMIRVLDSIINEHDTLWINAAQGESASLQAANVSYEQASASFAAQAMTRNLENSGFDRLLEMYRYNNSITEKAHRRLGFHYAVTGRQSAQQHLMFAFLIQNTAIIEEITRRQFDFSFTNLSALAQEIRRSAVLSSYVEEVEYYKTAYYLAASLYRNGKAAVARNLWAFLASVNEAGEWQSRALVQLRSPHLEPLVEMP